MSENNVKIVKPQFKKNINKDNKELNKATAIEKESTVLDFANKELKIDEAKKKIKDKEKKKMEKIISILIGLGAVVVVSGLIIWGVSKDTQIKEPAAQVQVTDNDTGYKKEITQEKKNEYLDRVTNSIESEGKAYWDSKLFTCTYDEYLSLYKYYRVNGFSESNSYELCQKYFKLHDKFNEEEALAFSKNSDREANYGEQQPIEIDSSPQSSEPQDTNNNEEEPKATSEEEADKPQADMAGASEPVEIPKELQEQEPEAEAPAPAPEAEKPAPTPAPEEPVYTEPEPDNSNSDFWGDDYTSGNVFDNIEGSTGHGFGDTTGIKFQ